jgi:type IV/VI secretion system ImpK/VasF family protein
MRLIELCQPLFQYICMLNRSSRRGGVNDLNQVQSELKAIFTQIAASAGNESSLRTRYQKIEPVLMIFVDEMIQKSHLSFAADWPSLAEAKGLHDGDEAFFDMMDATLRDPSSGALDELRVYYTCLGLGFTGWYGGQADHLRKRMLELSARLRGVGDADQASRIVPEAYEHVDTSNLIESPGASVAGILIGLMGIIAVLLLANVYLYQSSFHKLEGALQSITHDSQSGSGAAPADSAVSQTGSRGN